MEDIYANLNLPKQRTFLKDASFGRRLIAFFVDILLLDFIVLSSMAGFFPTMSFTLTTAAYAATVVSMLLALGYFTLFEYVLGQTPGMMLLSIHAVNITFFKALVRNSYLIPIFPFPLLWVVDPLHLAIKKLRFTEAVTKTRTVQQVVL